MSPKESLESAIKTFNRDMRVGLVKDFVFCTPSMEEVPLGSIVYPVQYGYGRETETVLDYFDAADADVRSWVENPEKTSYIKDGGKVIDLVLGMSRNEEYTAGVGGKVVAANVATNLHIKYTRTSNQNMVFSTGAVEIKRVKKSIQFRNKIRQNNALMQVLAEGRKLENGDHVKYGVVVGVVWSPTILFKYSFTDARTIEGGFSVDVPVQGGVVVNGEVSARSSTSVGNAIELAAPGTFGYLVEFFELPKAKGVPKAPALMAAPKAAKPRLLERAAPAAPEALGKVTLGTIAEIMERRRTFPDILQVRELAELVDTAAEHGLAESFSSGTRGVGSRGKKRKSAMVEEEATPALQVSGMPRKQRKAIKASSSSASSMASKKNSSPSPSHKKTLARTR